MAFSNNFAEFARQGTISLRQILEFQLEKKQQQQQYEQQRADKMAQMQQQYAWQKEQQNAKDLDDLLFNHPEVFVSNKELQREYDIRNGKPMGYGLAVAQGIVNEQTRLDQKNKDEKAAEEDRQMQIAALKDPSLQYTPQSNLSGEIPLTRKPNQAPTFFPIPGGGTAVVPGAGNEGMYVLPDQGNKSVANKALQSIMTDWISLSPSDKGSYANNPDKYLSYNYPELAAQGNSLSELMTGNNTAVTNPTPTPVTSGGGLPIPANGVDMSSGLGVGEIPAPPLGSPADTIVAYKAAVTNRDEKSWREYTGLLTRDEKYLNAERDKNRKETEAHQKDAEKTQAYVHNQIAIVGTQRPNTSGKSIRDYYTWGGPGGVGTLLLQQGLISKHDFESENGVWDRKYWPRVKKSIQDKRTAKKGRGNSTADAIANADAYTGGGNSVSKSKPKPVGNRPSWVGDNADKQLRAEKRKGTKFESIDLSGKSPKQRKELKAYYEKL